MKKSLFFLLGGGVIILTGIFALVLVYFLINIGYLQLIKTLPQWLQDPFTFAYMHLRGAIWWFTLLILVFSLLVFRIKLLLADTATTLAQLSYYDRLLNMTISLFFGVGVIYTAIGMENALLSALRGVGDGPALDAMGIMERLVNGGLLIALSTTIVGGSLGYALRFFKIVLIGPKWDETVLEKSS